MQKGNHSSGSQRVIALLVVLVTAVIVCPGVASASVRSAEGAVTPAPAPAVAMTLHGYGAIAAGDGVSCAESCSFTLPASGLLVLTAEPVEGYAFSGWGQGCSGDGTRCAVPAGSDAQVTATFVRSSLLELTVGGPGTVTGSAPTIDCGSGARGPCTATMTGVTTLAAMPAANAVFLGWGGPCAQFGLSSCQLSGAADAGVTATFGTSSVEPGEQAVDVEHGDLTLTSAPNALTACGSGAACGTVTGGTQMSLTAGGSFQLSPNQSLQSVVWSGACQGDWPVCAVAVDVATNIGVVPTIKAPSATTTNGRSDTKLTINTYGHGRVVLSRGSACRTPSTGCSVGQRVAVIAEADSGYQFYEWSTIGLSCRAKPAPVCEGKVAPSEQVEGAFQRIHHR